MAEWDIGFEVTAIIRGDVRNPNDTLVFSLSTFLDPARFVQVEKMNRSQILAYFNVIAISGKVSLAIDASNIEVVTRLYWAVNEPDRKVYQLELVAKSKRSISVVKSETLPYASKMEVHQPSVVGFMKLTDLKIVDIHPFRVMLPDNRHTISYVATFDGT
jgi:hypothetical protein